MVHLNREHGFEGVNPNDPGVLGSMQTTPPAVQDRDGLYSPAAKDTDITELSARLEGAEGLGQPTLLDYQTWAELKWKTEHGTFSSVERFTQKLDEEQRELFEALQDAANSGDESTVGEAISELGDVLWCMAALACNGSADIDAGMKNKLFQYISGVQWFDGGTAVTPPWRDEAARLAVKYDPISIDEIDGLIAMGFEPLPSAVMNVFNPDEDEYGINEHLLQLSGLIVNAQGQAWRQYGRDPNTPEEADDPNAIITNTGFSLMSDGLGEIAASTLLEIAFLSNRVSGNSLASVIATNVTKLTKRVAQKQIDKTDGPRDG